MNIRTLRSISLVALLWLMLSPSLPSVAQTNSDNEHPEDLVFNVSPQRKKYVGVTIPSRTSGDPIESQVTSSEQDSERMKKATPGSDISGLNIYVQNRGNKTVASIKGELLIISDGKEAASLQFASKGKISPGKAKRLAKVDIQKLEKPIRDRFLTEIEYGRAVARIRAERVEYEDGSIWQHP